jgi:predicted  nucleic acid-binding Zn-ribbon protein
MLPEEQELARLEAEQAELKERVSAAELELETIKTETAQFQSRYYQVVGRLYVQLDELDAEIGKVRLDQVPNDTTLKAHADAAKQKAQKSADEAGFVRAQPKPPPVISPDLKQAYRQAVKLMHPDLSVTEHGHRRRTELMALVNLAYERGDQAAIEKVIQEFREDPEWIIGEDIGSRIVKAVRRNAQLRRRLDEVKQEIDALQKSEIFQLKQNIQEAEAKGDDPLGELAKQLMQEILSRKIRLEAVREQAG